VAIGITATGSCLPPDVVSNQFFESTLDTTDEWIVSRTGIRERRRATAGVLSSDLGAVAATRALRAGALSTEQVAGLVVATSSPDYIQPSTACVVQAKLGLRSVPALDVSAVCAGFVYGLATAAGLMSSPARWGRTLVVGAEVYSKIMDYQDRTTCVFFGDGAGAVVLDQVPSGYGMLSAHLLADGTQLDIVGIPAGGTAEPASDRSVAERRHYFKMNGPGVWDFATVALPAVIKEALADAGLSVSDVDHLITHQANARLIEAVAAAVGMPMTQVPTTVEKYGNTAAASVPITLDEVVSAGRIKRGHIVVLASVGGGMTAGAVVLRWF
jgi:3-oxoacyl-[acyl-carrier-protein] synthase III